MPRARRRLYLATGSLLLTTFALTACFSLGGPTAPRPPADPGSTSTDDTATSEGETPVNSITSAVDASDPRVVPGATTITARTSGIDNVLSVVVDVTGDEPVSTQTLARIAVAALQSSADEIHQLDVKAFSAANAAEIDLGEAAAGLPAQVNARWNAPRLTIFAPDAATIGSVL